MNSSIASTTGTRGNWRRLAVDLLRLVRSWWRADRIRSMPPEGRLLRMSAGTLVTVRSHPAEIVGRSVGQTPAGVDLARERELIEEWLR